jgi:type IV pilus assembly protein PilP
MMAFRRNYVSHVGHATYAALLPALAIVLAGCSENGGEVKEWMKDVEKKTLVQVQPLPEPKKFIPFGYIGKTEIDPFNPNKLLVAIAKLKESTKPGLKIDETRVREFLEGFPLDSFKMVGTLQKAGVNVALVQIDKTVYKVKVGNYVGQNHGMITSINDSEINIKEIVQDATGDNVEHEAKLELQESKK